MAVKAIIFDMDGVLIDAKEWHYDSLNQALSLFGFKIERYEHLTSYDGLPTKTKLQKLSVEKHLPTYLHDFINEIKQQYTMEIIQNRCRPRFNHEFALSRLKSEGYGLAVASNSIRNTVDAMISKANLQQYLDFKLSNQDVKYPKPNPEIYSTAIARFGYEPKECLVIEDNENGIRAALASGANLLSVKEVDEVNYENIKKRIYEIENCGPKPEAAE